MQCCLSTIDSSWHVKNYEKNHLEKDNIYVFPCISRPSGFLSPDPEKETKKQLSIDRSIVFAFCVSFGNTCHYFNLRPKHLFSCLNIYCKTESGRYNTLFRCPNEGHVFQKYQRDGVTSRRNIPEKLHRGSWVGRGREGGSCAALRFFFFFAIYAFWQENWDAELNRDGLRNEEMKWAVQWEIAKERNQWWRKCKTHDKKKIDYEMII